MEQPEVIETYEEVRDGVTYTVTRLADGPVIRPGKRGHRRGKPWTDADRKARAISRNMKAKRLQERE